MHRRTLWDLCFERTPRHWGAEGGTYPYDHVFWFVQDTLGSGLGQAASCLLIILTLNYISFHSQKCLSLDNKYMATITCRRLGAQTRLPRGGIPADSGDGDRSCRRWASAISEGGGGWGGQADQGEGARSLLPNLSPWALGLSHRGPQGLHHHPMQCSHRHVSDHTALRLGHSRASFSQGTFSGLHDLPSALRSFLTTSHFPAPPQAACSTCQPTSGLHSSAWLQSHLLPEAFPDYRQ